MTYEAGKYLCREGYYHGPQLREFSICEQPAEWVALDLFGEYNVHGRLVCGEHRAGYPRYVRIGWIHINQEYPSV